MKKVLDKKRKYSYKDLYRILGIVFLHYFAFFVYALFFILIKYLLSSENIFYITDHTHGFIYYAVFVAPIISAVTHIIYAERGLPNMRALMWLHDLLVIVLLPILGFI